VHIPCVCWCSKPNGTATALPPQPCWPPVGPQIYAMGIRKLYVWPMADKMSGIGSIEKDMDLRGTLNADFSWKYMTSSAKRSGNASSASMPYNCLKPRVMRRKLSRRYDWSGKHRILSMPLREGREDGRPNYPYALCSTPPPPRLSVNIVRRRVCGPRSRVKE
jgi:hypothetical protein